MLHLKGLLAISSSNAYKLQIAAKRTVNFSRITKSQFDEQTRPAYIDSIYCMENWPLAYVSVNAAFRLSFH